MGAEILVETVAGGVVTAPAAPSPAEDDYRCLHEALSSSERGREFLAEFSRRNRHSDTEMLLAAVDRLETLMRADGTALERLRDELRMLLIAIRLVRPEIDAAAAPAKAEKLGGLLDMLERRLDAMAERKTGDTAALAEDPEKPLPTPALLSVVPVSDEPELPMPAPAAAPLPPIALVRPAVAMPEVTFVANAPLGPTVVDHATIEKAAAEKISTVAALPPVDPLAPILALSEFEKIALFT
jgi:hypothetical protein